jgi:hypothetical protein
VHNLLHREIAGALQSKGGLVSLLGKEEEWFLSLRGARLTLGEPTNAPPGPLRDPSGSAHLYRVLNTASADRDMSAGCTYPRETENKEPDDSRRDWASFPRGGGLVGFCAEAPPPPIGRKSQTHQDDPAGRQFASQVPASEDLSLGGNVGQVPRPILVQADTIFGESPRRRGRGRSAGGWFPQPGVGRTYMYMHTRIHTYTHKPHTVQAQLVGFSLAIALRSLSLLPTRGPVGLARLGTRCPWTR